MSESETPKPDYLDPENTARVNQVRRRRNVVIGLSIVGLMVLLYIVTMVRIGFM